MSNQIQEDWPKIIDILINEYDITPAAYKAWIQKLSVYSVQDHKVLILVDDSVAALLDYVQKRYTQPLKVTISEFYNEDYDVEITKRSNLSSSDKASRKESGPTDSLVSAGRINDTLNPKYTFDTFVVGNTNNLAYATALAVADNPGEYGNPLFIYGGVGLGKTHLMQSIAHYALEHNPDFRVIYTTTEAFSSELIAAIKNRTQENFKEKYRSIDMLLIDDIQFIAGKDSTMEEFFYTFNELYEHKKQIVISSDKPQKEMVGLEERLISRFKVGLTVDIQAPDYDTRVAILEKRAEHYDIEVDDSAMHYIAKHIVSNIRELEGALNQIINFAKLKHTNHVDEEIAKEVLKDMIEPEKARPITPDLIIDMVVEQFNYKITAADIKGKNRSREIAYPRQICMYLCEKYTGLSLAAIGAALGNKDHSTVLHGTRKIRMELEENEQLRNTVDIIARKLNLPVR